MARTSPSYPLMTCWNGPSSAGAAAEAGTPAPGQAAPDAEALVVGQCVLQALGPDLAAGADLLGLAGRAALLREERLGVGLGAQRALLPALLLTVEAGDAGVVDVGHAEHVGPVGHRRGLGGSSPVVVHPRHVGHGHDAFPLRLVPAVVGLFPRCHRR